MFVLPLLAAATIGLLGSIVKIVKVHRANSLMSKSLELKVPSNDGNFIAISLDGSMNIEKNISLAINGQNYLFGMPSVDINVSNILHDLAIEFCEQRGDELGFSMKTFSLCVNPIVENLEDQLRREESVDASDSSDSSDSSDGSSASPDESVEKEPTVTKEKKTVEVPLEINGVSYVFEYIIGVDKKAAASTLADHFCRGKGTFIP